MSSLQFLFDPQLKTLQHGPNTNRLKKKRLVIALKKIHTTAARWMDDLTSTEVCVDSIPLSDKDEHQQIYMMSMIHLPAEGAGLKIE